MKTTNYLYLEYRRTLRKFQKLQSRFEKRIIKGTLSEITARKRYFLLRKIERLKEKLAKIGKRLQLAGIAGAMGLSVMASEANAQLLPEKTKTYDRELLNDIVTGDQTDASVAMNNNGDVVTVWKDGVYNVRGKKVFKDGTESSFDVFTGVATYYASHPEVAIDENGDFAVVWQQYDQAYLESIQLEKFDGTTLLGLGQVMVQDISEGEVDQKISIELQSDGDVYLTYVDYDDVNSNQQAILNFIPNGELPPFSPHILKNDSDYESYHPSMSLDNEGNLGVVWLEDELGDAPYYYVGERVQYQRFIEGSVGEPLASGSSVELVQEFFGYYSEFYPENSDIELLADGDILVTWLEQNSYYSEYNLFFRKFDIDGNALNPRTSAHSFNSYGNREPVIESEAQGAFAITFQEDFYGTPRFWTKRFNNQGIYVDEVNSFPNPYSNFSSGHPSFDMNDKGDFAVVWSDSHDSQWSGAFDREDEDGYASFLSKYEKVNKGHARIYQDDIVFGQITGATISSDDDGDYILAWSNGTSWPYTINAQRFSADGKKSGDEILIYTSDDYSAYSIDIDLNNAGQFVVAWNEESGIYKRSFDELNNPSSTHLLSQDYSDRDVSVAIDQTGDFSVVAWVDGLGSDELRINTGTSELDVQEVNDVVVNPSSSIYSHDVDMMTGDNFVVVWEDTAYPDGSGSTTYYPSIYQRKYENASPSTDAEIVADAQSSGSGFENPQVSANHETGDYVIAYSNKYGVEAVVYHEYGSQALANFVVNDEFSTNYDNPVQVDMNENGDFAIAWEGSYNGNQYGSIMKKYNFQGEVILPEIRAFNTSPELSGIAMGDRETIVASYNSTRVYHSIISDPVGFEFSDNYENLVNTQTSGYQENAAIATNYMGQFVITWFDSNDDTMRAQRYDESGTEYGDELTISNSPSFTTYFSAPQVELAEDGNFLIVWAESYGGNEVLAQLTAWDGTVLQDDFVVNTIPGESVSPNLFSTEQDENGDFVVVYSMDYQQDYQNSYLSLKKYSASTGTETLSQEGIFNTTFEEGIIENLAVAMNSDGDLAVAYQYNYYDQINYKNYDFHFLRTFETVGFTAQQSNPILIETGDFNCDCSIIRPMNLIADRNGDFIISTTQFDYAESTTTLHRYVPGEEAISGDPVCAAYGQRSDMTLADNGDIVLVYDRYQEGSVVDQIFTSRVNSNFEMIEGELELSTLSTTSENASVVMVSYGTFVATWESYQLDGNLDAIAKREFHSFRPAMQILQNPLSINEGSSEIVGYDDTYVINNSSLEPVTFVLTSYPTNGELQINGNPVAPLSALNLANFEILTYVHDGSETISDSFDYLLNNGTFDSELFTMDLTINPINDIPDLTANNGMNLDEGDTQSLYEALNLNDPDNSGEELLYTIITLPTHGSLWNVENTDFQLGIGDTFSQNDVSFAYIEYRHNGDEEITDSFDFTYGDLEFTSEVETFDISVNAINDLPLLTTVNAEVIEGESVNITSANLSAIDGDHIANQVFYEITQLPEYGELQLDGVALELNDTFTQDDINNTLLIYVNDGTNPLLHSSYDEFGFDLSDPEEVATSDYFSFDIADVNDLPVIEQVISDQDAIEDQLFIFDVPAGTFSDEESSELMLTAMQSDGSALPTWLSFDGLTFSGTPLHGDSDVSVELAATDDESVSVVMLFNILVGQVNEPPVVSTNILDQNAIEDEEFSFDVLSGIFSDEETTNLTLTASQSDDSPLPVWLTFDGSNFSGIPLHGDTDVEIELTATDGGDPALSVSTVFNVVIEQLNDEPQTTGISDEVVFGYDPFKIQVEESFFDEERHELTLSATLSDGSPLPSFLNFNPEIGEFSGQALINIDEGEYDIIVTATENTEDQNSVSTTFKLTMAAVLSTQETLAEEVSVYPNPASDKLVAKLDNSFTGRFQVQLVDQTGKLVYNDAFEKQNQVYEYQLNVESLSSGLYILRLVNENTSLTFKVNKK